MKVWEIVSAAVVGSAIASMGVVAVFVVGEQPPALSISYLHALAESNFELIGLTFVVAFALLSLVIFVYAANAELSRIRIQFEHSAWADGTRVGSLYSVFVGTSAATAARKLDEALGEARAIRAEEKSASLLYLGRSIRLEIRHIYVQRIVAIQILTLLLYATYSALLGSRLSLALSERLPWSVLVAAIAMAVLGFWLWIDNVVEGTTTAVVKFWRPIVHPAHSAASGEVDQLPVDLSTERAVPWQIVEPTIARYHERIELANEALFQRIVELIFGNAEREEPGQKKSDRSAEGAELGRRLDDLKKSVSEFTGRVVPLLSRLSADQDRIYAAVRKQDSELTSASQRSHELSAKLDAIDAGLEQIARSQRVGSAEPSTLTQPDAKGRAVSGVLANSLEQLLSELSPESSNDKSDG